MPPGPTCGRHRAGRSIRSRVSGERPTAFHPRHVKGAGMSFTEAVFRLDGTKMS
ncbi:MAG: hypothetical protein U0176_25760 [Bacteroidia bacterium]